MNQRGQTNVSSSADRLKGCYAVLFLIVIQITTFPLESSDHLYPGFRFPRLHPPVISIPFIWAVLNVCAVLVGLRILNNRSAHSRNVLLVLQGMFWLNFAVVPYVYYGKTGMLMEIVLTLLINFVAVSELVLVWRGDKRANLLMASVAGWGAFAGVLFLLWQLLCSSDPAFRSLADLTATH